MRSLRIILQRYQGLPQSFRELNFSLQLLSILRSLGWHRSLRRSASVDLQGNPIPWFTYPAIQWLASRVKPSDSVFEFGAGHSTLWFSARVRKLIAVEHSEAWFNYVRGLVGPNVTLLLRPCLGNETEGNGESEYVRSIEEVSEEGFDVIEIDGEQRVPCILAAARKLKQDGLIILDNSERTAYRAGIEYLMQEKFGRIDFFGGVPGYGTWGCTSVFGKFLSRWTGGEGLLPCSED